MMIMMINYKNRIMGRRYTLLLLPSKSEWLKFPFLVYFARKLLLQH